MKAVRFNFHSLMGQKGQRENRRITRRTVADETGISRHTVYAMADGSIKLIPTDVLIQLCGYFECNVGDLLTLVDASPTTPPDAN